MCVCVALMCVKYLWGCRVDASGWVDRKLAQAGRSSQHHCGLSDRSSCKVCLQEDWSRLSSPDLHSSESGSWLSDCAGRHTAITQMRLSVWIRNLHNEVWTPNLFNSYRCDVFGPVDVSWVCGGKPGAFRDVPDVQTAVMLWRITRRSQEEHQRLAVASPATESLREQTHNERRLKNTGSSGMSVGRGLFSPRSVWWSNRPSDHPERTLSDVVAVSSTPFCD